MGEKAIIFFWVIYISTGKYTVKGQKLMAPRSASTSLKNGMDMARTVVNTTNVVLQKSFRRLILRLSWSIPGTEYPCVMNLVFGHLREVEDSTAAKTGRENT